LIPLIFFFYSSYRRFREEQLNAVIELSSLKALAIIATGAEVALVPQCALLIREMGTVILIKRDVQLLLEEVSKCPHRLILRDVDNGLEIDMDAKAVEEYAKEIDIYEEVAHKIFENNGDEESAITKLTGFLKELYRLDLIDGNG
jgi:shikimate kinase